mgnify:CR=1 FL=1
MFLIPLPVLVFSDLATVDFEEVWNMKFVLFCFGATVISIAISTAVSFLWKDKSIQGEFIQSSYRSSAALLGIAFIQNIYGQSTMGSLMIIGAVPLYNIYSVLVLTFEGDYPENERDTGRIKQAGINILKNPIIIGIVLGLIVALLHNPLPELVNSTVNNVAKMATPLALIGLGAGFEGKKALAKIKPTLWAAFIKLIAQAANFYSDCGCSWFSGRKNGRTRSHAGSTGNPELLYHGKKYA